MNDHQKRFEAATGQKLPFDESIAPQTLTISQMAATINYYRSRVNWLTKELTEAEGVIEDLKNWVSLEDRFPEEGVDVLICRIGEEDVLEAYYINNSEFPWRMKRLHSSLAFTKWTPTHWKPLPPVPTSPTENNRR